MWKELLEAEQRKLEDAQKEFDYQLNVVWKNANTITQRQNAEKRRIELKEIIDLAKINIETYRITAIAAGEIEPELEPKIIEEIPEKIVEETPEEPEMTPLEAMNTLLSLLNGNEIKEAEDDTYDEKNDI